MTFENTNGWLKRASDAYDLICDSFHTRTLLGVCVNQGIRCELMSDQN